MKSIYLVEKLHEFNRVYDEPMKVRIASEGGPAPENVFCRADVLAAPERFHGVEYVFSTWSMPVFTEQEIADCFPSLKAVFYGAGTVQSFARPFLARGISVFSAWAANAVPVAEYAVAQIVLACKGFFLTCRLTGNHRRPEAKEALKKYPGSFGCKIGLIGVGMIGSMVAERLKDYRYEVLAFDPFCSEEKAARLGVKLCSLETIFSECQVISNHLANNPATVGMLDGKLFSLMKESATFINTGRGAQVVEPELAKVLAQRPYTTAVLDVTYPEPIQEGNPLWEMENVFLTPHIAGSQGDECHRMAEYMLEEFVAFAKGAPTRYSVSEAMLATMA